MKTRKWNKIKSMKTKSKRNPKLIMGMKSFSIQNPGCHFSKTNNSIKILTTYYDNDPVSIV